MKTGSVRKDSLGPLISPSSGKRTEEEQRFYEIKPAQRWTMAAMYFDLIAALVFGMHVALAQLQVTASIRKRGHRCNKRRSGTSR